MNSLNPIKSVNQDKTLNGSSQSAFHTKAIKLTEFAFKKIGLFFKAHKTSIIMVNLVLVVGVVRFKYSALISAAISLVCMAIKLVKKYNILSKIAETAVFDQILNVTGLKKYAFAAKLLSLAKNLPTAIASGKEKAAASPSKEQESDEVEADLETEWQKSVNASASASASSSTVIDVEEKKKMDAAWKEASATSPFVPVVGVESAQVIDVEEKKKMDAAWKEASATSPFVPVVGVESAQVIDVEEKKKMDAAWKEASATSPFVPVVGVESAQVFDCEENEIFEDVWKEGAVNDSSTTSQVNEHREQQARPEPVLAKAPASNLSETAVSTNQKDKATEEKPKRQSLKPTQFPRPASSASSSVGTAPKEFLQEQQLSRISKKAQTVFAAPATLSQANGFDKVDEDEIFLGFADLWPAEDLKVQKDELEDKEVLEFDAIWPAEDLKVQKDELEDKEVLEFDAIWPADKLNNQPHRASVSKPAQVEGLSEDLKVEKDEPEDERSLIFNAAWQEKAKSALPATPTLDFYTVESHELDTNVDETVEKDEPKGETSSVFNAAWQEKPMSALPAMPTLDSYTVQTDELDAHADKKSMEKKEQVDRRVKGFFGRSKPAQLEDQEEPELVFIEENAKAMRRANNLIGYHQMLTEQGLPKAAEVKSNPLQQPSIAKATKLSIPPQVRSNELNSLRRGLHLAGKYQELMELERSIRMSPARSRM